MAADEQAKEGATKSEPPQQMMSEYVQRRHMIPDAQTAAVHTLEWRGMRNCSRRQKTGESEQGDSGKEKC